MPVGRHWPKRAPRGDFSAECDICGVVWRRSQLELKADGFLYCPDDVSGRDIVTLNEGNVAAARAREMAVPRESGGTLRNDVTAPTDDVATVVGSVTFGNGGGH
jgi:hypothetical protein